MYVLDSTSDRWYLREILENISSLSKEQDPSDPIILNECEAILSGISRDILKKKQLVTFIPYKMVQISAVTAHTVVRAVYSGISAGSNNPIMWPSGERIEANYSRGKRNRKKMRYKELSKKIMKKSCSRKCRIQKKSAKKWRKRKSWEEETIRRRKVNDMFVRVDTSSEICTICLRNLNFG